MKRELYETLLLKREEEIEEGDSEALEALLRDWEELKEATRAHMEACRRELGGSGFDFKKAMVFREQADLERLRLDRAMEKVAELEDRLGW